MTLEEEQTNNRYTFIFSGVAYTPRWHPNQADWGEPLESPFTKTISVTASNIEKATESAVRQLNDEYNPSPPDLEGKDVIDYEYKTCNIQLSIFSLVGSFSV